MKRSKRIVFVLVGLCFVSSTTFAQQKKQPARPVDTEQVKYSAVSSKLLSDFWGKEIKVEAGVYLPPNFKQGESLPVLYDVHGFGGSYRTAWRRASRLTKAMEQEKMPRLIVVFLQAQNQMAHHVFADSPNTGPWGSALTQEFIPALEKKYGLADGARARFLTGHSSGGWSSLWLQVAYPEFFNGTWSTAPDSMDFRDFTGINIYEYANAFEDPEGNPIQLMRRGSKWIASIEQFVEREISNQPYGGQMFSFNAVFSPKGWDGQPKKLFDWKTGVIDSKVAKAWEKFDISLKLKRNWKTLEPQLKGKLHVLIGDLDTFRLEGASRLFKDVLKDLGSDGEVVIVAGRNHSDLFRPHEKEWPEGLQNRIYHEVNDRFQKTVRAASPPQ